MTFMMDAPCGDCICLIYDNLLRSVAITYQVLNLLNRSFIYLFSNANRDVGYIYFMCHPPTTTPHSGPYVNMCLCHEKEAALNESQGENHQYSPHAFSGWY